ncbi:MAG: flagellar basal-body MS-ring/collar protein FliF [Acidobacteriota bacterium]
MVASAFKSGLDLWRKRQGAWPTLPPALFKSLVPLALLALGITALVMLFVWRDQADYKPVFGAREKVAAADMMAVLDAEKVPYRVHPDSGQVLVPDAQLGKVRMLLAAKGVTAKLPAGLELMDRSDPLGVSQFVQDVRFRRGLEGELAQSILTIDAVEAARVHLSIARSTSFIASDGEKSSASVVLALKPGRKLGAEQIAAIINLVAGSVASLDPKRVSLIDQAGNLLSAHVDLSEGFDAVNGQGNEAARRYQEETQRNVRDLLAPVLGEDNFKTSVTADVDNDRVEETREQYGETPKVTTEATREEQDRDTLAVGVPGSLSNRPVAVAASGPAAMGSAHRNATTRQYAYDRHITQIKRSRGRLNKLSVAVVLNNTGRATAWTAPEIAQIDKLLRNGLGMDETRGDQLMVSALAFPVRPVAQPWWQERNTVIDLGTNALYVVGTVLGFVFVIRPLLQMARQSLAHVTQASHAPNVQTTALTELTASRAPTNTAEASVPAGALAAPESAPLALPPAPGGAQAPVMPLMENYDLPPPGSPVDVMVDHLKVLAGKEPERVAEVVKQWVQKHERTQ